MSASLVGSEMCIRDSPAQRARGPPLPGCAQGLRGGRPRASVPHAQSVSYTHLTLPTICSV
eukprot:1609278-Alexandrium_andersonii.AAC.1